MYSKKPLIDIDEYYQDMKMLSYKISDNYDCIVALKRSGFILGAYLSNQKTIPLFIPSELKSIPENFNKILIVDDKICTGKSLNKVKNKLPFLVDIKTACIYVESNVYPDIFVKKLPQISRMWYEKD